MLTIDFNVVRRKPKKIIDWIKAIQSGEQVLNERHEIATISFDNETISIDEFLEELSTKNYVCQCQDYRYAGQKEFITIDGEEISKLKKKLGYGVMFSFEDGLHRKIVFSVESNVEALRLIASPTPTLFSRLVHPFLLLFQQPQEVDRNAVPAGSSPGSMARMAIQLAGDPLEARRQLQTQKNSMNTQIDSRTASPERSTGQYEEASRLAGPVSDDSAPSLSI